MTADEIKAILEAHHPGLHSKRLKRGWSFWLGLPRGAGQSNRLLRVTQTRDGALECKLSISSRLQDRVIMGRPATAGEVRALFDQELRLYRAHFE